MDIYDVRVFLGADFVSNKTAVAHFWGLSFRLWARIHLKSTEILYKNVQPTEVSAVSRLYDWLITRNLLIREKTHHCTRQTA